MTYRDKYKDFCKQEENIPLFSQYWWLDTVCGEDNWDVVLIEKDRKIVASIPYYKTRRLLLNIISMPILTQTMGVYIKYPKGQKYYKRLSWEKSLMNQLIEGLPSFDYFSQNFNYSIINWLPFYWKGFSQTTRYTYVIENISMDEVEKNFETDIRRRRKKAYKLGVKVYESNDIKKFYELNKMTFSRQKKGIPYSFEFIRKLYTKCKNNNAVKIYFAEYEGDVIAANFLVYDIHTVYYLMGGIDSNRKDLGAMDIILYESIKFALESGRKFDFEGSMVESIEKYFRSFGAIQKPYFVVTKNNSKLLKLKQLIREIIK